VRDVAQFWEPYAHCKKAYIVTLSEALAVLAAFLTIIVSTVFVVNFVPSTVLDVGQATWFGSQDFGKLNGTAETRTALGIYSQRATLFREGGQSSAIVTSVTLEFRATLFTPPGCPEPSDSELLKVNSSSTLQVRP